MLTGPCCHAADTCRVAKAEAKRLPDLNIPRAGHQLFFVNDELVVAGGHTNGFVPTPTAEYLKDGEWHVIQMAYNHDFCGSVVLKSGKVLLLGGTEQPIGIGQTFLAELYDPATHTFDGFGSMQRKRTFASALELDSGKVIISGNWYHDDGIEVFDGQKRFTYIKDVADQRSAPHIFRISKDDALMVGFCSTKGDTLFSAVADRLRGDTVHIPLLESWLPLSIQSHRDGESLIGDASKGEYIYLMPVRNKSGQVAIAKVANGAFSLLPTDCPVPMQCQGTDIFYSGHIVVDRKAGRAYMMGHANYIRTMPEKESPLYLLCIDYGKALSGQPATLTLYYTDPLPVVPDYPPVVTDEGDLVIAGGLIGVDNFTPSQAAFLFHLDQGPQVAASSQNGSLWLWLLLAAAVIVAAAAFAYLRRRRPRPHGSRPQQEDPQSEVPTSADSQLMDRISTLMNEKQLYLDSELKVADIASALHTNRLAISNCINSQCNCSFTQFVNTYRINHAKELLRSQPELKILEVWMQSGFATERTFLRTFKAATDMTPSEFREKID